MPTRWTTAPLYDGLGWGGVGVHEGRLGKNTLGEFRPGCRMRSHRQKKYPVKNVHQRHGTEHMIDFPIILFINDYLHLFVAYI